VKELVEYLARGLVDEPDAVTVEEYEDNGRIIYHLMVAPDDMGKVIGKQGRIANSMRSLLKVAAVRRGERVALEIGDD
jgi:predicted RNA-binding protein YlqC (UPF0109 family)